MCCGQRPRITPLMPASRQCGTTKLAAMAQILRLVPGQYVAESRAYPGKYGWVVPKTTSGHVEAADFNGDKAIKVGRTNRTSSDYWLYRKKLYVTTDQDLTPDDVAALINESANRRRLQLEKAHALQAMTEELSKGSKRAHIPQDVKILVWQRDSGRCVSCASQSDLEFDHIIPVAMGGSNTARNLQLLCEVCNRRKGATLG